LSTTLDRFEESCGTLGKEWKKNPPLSSTIFISRFERSCGICGEEKKLSLSSTTLNQFV
jgi:hypothetical protein